MSALRFEPLGSASRAGRPALRARAVAKSGPDDDNAALGEIGADEYVLVYAEHGVLLGSEARRPAL